MVQRTIVLLSFAAVELIAQPSIGSIAQTGTCNIAGVTGNVTTNCGVDTSVLRKLQDDVRMQLKQRDARIDEITKEASYWKRQYISMADRYFALTRHLAETGTNDEILDQLASLHEDVTRLRNDLPSSQKGVQDLLLKLESKVDRIDTELIASATLTSVLPSTIVASYYASPKMTLGEITSRQSTDNGTLLFGTTYNPAVTLASLQATGATITGLVAPKPQTIAGSRIGAIDGTDVSLWPTSLKWADTASTLTATLTMIKPDVFNTPYTAVSDPSSASQALTAFSPTSIGTLFKPASEMAGSSNLLAAYAEPSTRTDVTYNTTFPTWPSGTITPASGMLLLQVTSNLTAKPDALLKSVSTTSRLFKEFDASSSLAPPWGTELPVFPANVNALPKLGSDATLGNGETVAKFLTGKIDSYTPFVYLPASYEPVGKTGNFLPCSCILQGTDRGSLLKSIDTLTAQGKIITGWTIGVRELQ